MIVQDHMIKNFPNTTITILGFFLGLAGGLLIGLAIGMLLITQYNLEVLKCAL